MKKRLFYIPIMCLLFTSVAAQDIESTVSQFRNRLKNDPIKASGLISLGGNMTRSNLPNYRAYPFAGNAMAALNLDILGIRAPFSLVYGTGGKAFNYSLPSYAFMGISPSYRWAKLHIGDRTLPLGKYTFNGQSFRGIGAEFTPGNWEISGFYGKIRRASVQDFAGINKIDPLFGRYGIGGKAAYKTGKSKYNISFLNAWDEIDPANDQDTLSRFTPAENAVFAMELTQQLTSVIGVNISLARSAYSYDIQLPNDQKQNLWRSFGGLVKPNNSTTWGNAILGEFFVKTGFGQFTFGYEKVDPGFKTMGSLFFRNDLENVNAGGALFLLKKKLVINTKAGIQRNNLNNDKAKEFSRFVFLINTTYKYNERLDLYFQYNNFNSVNRNSTIENIALPITTNSLVFTNKEINGGLNFLLENTADVQTILQFQSGMSKGQSILNDEITDNGVNNYSLSLFANRSYLSSKFDYGLSISHFSNQFVLTKVKTNSLGFNLAKTTADEKWSINLYTGSGQNVQHDDLSKTSNIFITGNLGIQYKMTESIKTGLSTTYYQALNQKDIAGFFESRTRIILTYNFKAD